MRDLPAIPSLPGERRIDLAGWASHALPEQFEQRTDTRTEGRGEGRGEPYAGKRDERELRAARVLWRTAHTCAAGTSDPAANASAWFDDLASGRLIVPGDLAIVDPIDRSSAAFEPVYESVAGDENLAAVARALHVASDRPDAVLVLAGRVRWVHPAVRATANGLAGPPRCRAWLNVAAFFNESRGLDWHELRAATDRAVRLLDAALTQGALDDAWRRMALGLAGLGDLLARLGVPFGSPESLHYARRVANAVVERAHRTSESLAEERGEFGRFPSTRWAALGRARRNALCTASWTSDGLAAAVGVSEGIGPALDQHEPIVVQRQLALLAEVQRAFEGCVHGRIVVSEFERDVDQIARGVIEHDLQCLSIDTHANAELRPRRARRTLPGLEVAAALRLDAPARGGRWTLYLAFDANGRTERELVALAVPLGSDGWRHVERINARLSGGQGLEHALLDFDCGDATLRAMLESYLGQREHGEQRAPRT